MVNKLYVLVRGDLSKSQQAVQACHAVAEFMLYNNEISCWCGECPSETRWPNHTIVLLKVKDLADLHLWRDSIKEKCELAEFCEPDIGNEMTAIAAHGNELQDMLKGLPLL